MYIFVYVKFVNNAENLLLLAAELMQCILLEKNKQTNDNNSLSVDCEVYSKYAPNNTERANKYNIDLSSRGLLLVRLSRCLLNCN